LNTSRAGSGLEHEARNMCQAAGYDVMRGAGSKGRVAGFDCDLVATKYTDKNKRTLYMVLFQCKRTKLKSNKHIKEDKHGGL